MKKNNNLLKDVAPYLNTGIQLIAPILIGVYFGLKLDKGREFPIWTLILSLCGIALGMFSFIYNTLENNKKQNNDKR